MKKRTKIKNPDPKINRDTTALFKNLVERIIELGPLFLLGVAPLVYLKIGGEFDNNTKMALLQWGIAILAIIQILRFRKDKPLVWKRTPLDLPILSFYCFCWISLINAANPYVAVLLLLHWCAAIIFFFFLVNTMKNEDVVDNVFLVIALSALIVSIIGILQKLFDFSVIPQLTGPASTFANRNMASQFIAMTLPIIAGLIMIAKEIKIKIISSVCIIFSSVYLMLTKTRSAGIAIIAVFILSIIAFLISPGMKKYARLKKTVSVLILTFLAVGLLCFYQPAREVLKLDNRVPEITSLIKKFDKGTTSLRIGWWQNTVAMVNDHYWQGIGLGNFKLIYPIYHRASRVDTSFGEDRQVNRVHNDHLQIFAELGFAGFCMYVWIFITFFYLFIKTIQKAKHRDTRLRAFFILLGTVSFIVIAFFTFPMERAVPPILLFTYFALMAFLYRSSSEEPGNNWSFPFQKTGRIVVVGFLIVFLCSSFFFIRKIVLSDKYFVHSIALGTANRIEEANTDLKMAKIFSKWNFNIASLLGRNYMLQGKYHEAIKEYDESFTVNPNNTNAILNTGYCYLKLKDYDEAERHFNKYIELIPDSAKAVNNLGIVYFSKNDYVRAEEYYKKASALNKKYAEPHYNLANLYRKQGKIDLAIKQYYKTLALNPQLNDARHFLCNIYIRAKNFDMAHNTANPLLKNRSSLVTGHMLKGDIYQAQNEHKKALFHYIKALQLAPKNPLAYHKAGLSYYYLHNYSEAEKFLEKSLSLNPDSPQTLNLLAQLYIRKKDDEKAEKLYEKALANDPKLSEARFNLGNIYLRAGKLREASVAFSQVLAVSPDFTPAHYNLATILKRFNRNGEALFHFKKSIEKPSKHINTDLAKKFIAELEKKTSGQ